MHKEEKPNKTWAVVGVVAGIMVCSGIILLILGPNKLLPSPWNYISQYIGWLYFCCWSISFYPQVFLNYRRKSVVGLSFDFLAYNFVAFTCYTIYNFSMLYVPEIQKEYWEMFHQHVPVVVNDLFFSAHAMVITAFTIFQTFIYERNDQRVSNTAIAILSLIFVFIIVCIVGVWMHWFSWLNPLMVIIIFSNIKLVISFIKYIPQLVFNYRRKSTYPSHCHMRPSLHDFSGGTLSIIQFFMNCAILNEWSGLKSNIVKLGLGSVSMFFDILFMIQHYILYPNHDEAPLAEPLVLDSIEKQERAHSHSKLVSLNSIKTP